MDILAPLVAHREPTVLGESVSPLSRPGRFADHPQNEDGGAAVGVA
jgi:hypothetical protein